MQGKAVQLFILINIGTILSSFSPGTNPGWETDSLNTAAHTTYLSTFDKEVVLEINKLRSNPARYARMYIEPMRNYYRGRKLYYPNDLPLITTEGVRALIECSNALKLQQPVPILKPSYGLTKAAGDHVKDQSETGSTGHKGRDRSGFRERIERYGDWKVRIAENIAYGGITPRQVVVYLLIDDGIPSRGHRKNFLNKDFKLIGVANGKHPSYNNMCVMEFAGDFQNIALR